MTEPAGLPVPQRYWALAVVMTGIVMTVLDGSIINIALPSLSRTLHVSPSETVWTVNAYQLGACVLLLPLATLGELVGYRRVYLVGMVVFTLASLACALAPSLPILVVARLLQGLGSAGVLCTNSALIRHAVPPRLIGRIVGMNAFLIGVSSASAPSIASAILSVASWRWLFAVNLPFGVAAIVLGAWALPHSENAKRNLDYISAALTALTVAPLIFGLDLVVRGMGFGAGWGLLVLSAAAGVSLARREWRVPAPLMPIDLLRIPIIGLSILTSTASFCAQAIALVALPFLFQLSLGRNILVTGLLMTAWPLSGATASLISGWASDKAPVAIMSTAGLICFAIGLALLASMPITVTNIDVVWRMVLCGFGFGFFQAPNNRTILVLTPSRRIGASGGLLALARTLGMSLGAVFTALLLRTLAMHAANVVALYAAAGLAVAAAGVSAMRMGSVIPSTDRVETV